MTIPLATIGLKVDSTGVVQAADNLDEFTAAGKRAEKAADDLVKQSGKTSAGLKDAAASTDKAAAAAGKHGTATRRQASDMAAAGISAGQYKQAMRQLPAQITDIITGLLSGQAPFTVAIQQGGQLKDSFGGIGPAARALIGAISPLAAGLTVGAAGAAALAYGFIKGQDESEDLARSLIMTGGYADVTAGQLGLIAENIGAIVSTRSAAAEVLGMLVSTGRVGGESLHFFAQSALEAERNLGRSTKEIAKDFADLGREPVQASLKLNDALHYLSASTLQQIQALMEAGKQTEAAKLAQEAYANAIKDRSAEMEKNLGSIQRAWRDIKDEATGAWDAMLGVGRTRSPEEELAALVARRGSRPIGTYRGERGQQAVQRQADSRERELQPMADWNKVLADMGSDYQRIQDAAILAGQANKQWSDAALTRQEKLNKELQNYRDNLADLRRADLMAPLGTPSLVPSAAQQAREEAAIRQKYAGPKADQSGMDQFIQNLKEEEKRITDQWTADAEYALRQALAQEDAGRQLAKDAGIFSKSVMDAGRRRRRSARSGVTYGDVNAYESSMLDDAGDEYMQKQTGFDAMKGGLDPETQAKTQLEIYQQYEDQKTAITEAAEAARAAITDQYLTAGAQALGDAAEAAAMFGKKGFAAYKAFAIAQAVISTYQSAVAAYASLAPIPYVGPALGVAAAAAAIGAGMARVSAIRSAEPAGYMSGGYTGNYGRAEVAGVVHGQEYVVNANATQRYRGMLEQMNSGAPVTAASGGGASGSPPQNINVHNYGNDRARIERRSNGDIDVIIGQAVTGSMNALSRDQELGGPLTQQRRAIEGGRPIVRRR